MKRNNFLSYIIRFLEQKYMASLHARFASAIPFSIVHSPFCIAQVKYPCSALFPWSWNVDIWMLILPTVAKVNIALFVYKLCKKSYMLQDQIQSNLIYYTMHISICSQYFPMESNPDERCNLRWWWCLNKC